MVLQTSQKRQCTYLKCLTLGPRYLLRQLHGICSIVLVFPGRGYITFRHPTSPSLSVATEILSSRELGSPHQKPIRCLEPCLASLICSLILYLPISIVPLFPRIPYLHLLPPLPLAVRFFLVAGLCTLRLQRPHLIAIQPRCFPIF